MDSGLDCKSSVFGLGWYISLIGLLLAASLFLFPKFKNKVWWQEIILIIMLFIAIGVKLLC